MSPLPQVPETNVRNAQGKALDAEIQSNICSPAQSTLHNVQVVWGSVRLKLETGKEGFHILCKSGDRQIFLKLSCIFCVFSGQTLLI